MKEQYKFRFEEPPVKPEKGEGPMLREIILLGSWREHFFLRRSVLWRIRLRKLHGSRLAKGLQTAEDADSKADQTPSALPLSTEREWDSEAVPSVF